jgi:hypothetical protein
MRNPESLAREGSCSSVWNSYNPATREERRRREGEFQKGLSPSSVPSCLLRG